MNVSSVVKLSKRLRSFQAHKRHHGGTPFVCKTCSKVLNTAWSLRNHERIHTGEKPYKCKECGKAFLLNVTLQKHMITHTGMDLINAKECERVFIHPSSFKSTWESHTGKHINVTSVVKMFGIIIFKNTSRRTHSWQGDTLNVWEWEIKGNYTFHLCWHAWKNSQWTETYQFDGNVRNLPFVSQRPTRLHTGWKSL